MTLEQAAKNVKTKELRLKTEEERLRRASLLHAAAWEAHALALHQWSEIRFGPWPE